MAFVDAKCPNCGGNIQLDDSKETGFCLHCGSKIEVSGAIKKVKIDNTDNVDKYIVLARNADKGGNNKEAEEYCNRILEIEPTNLEAWFLKGKNIGWQSTIANNRISEVISAFNQCLGLIDRKNEEEKYDEYFEKMCEELDSLGTAIITLVLNNFKDYQSESNCNDFVNQITILITSMVSFMIDAGKMHDVKPLYGFASVYTHNVIGEVWPKLLQEYGSKKEDRTEYAWRDLIENGDYCLILIQSALEFSTDSDTAKLLYDDYVLIQNYLINSGSYKYSCWWNALTERYVEDYVLEYTLTENAKLQRRELIQKITDKYKEKNEQFVKEAEEELKKYYAENPEELLKQKEEKEKMIELHKKSIENKKSELSKVNKEIEELETKLTQLGLFKISQKKEIKNDISNKKTLASSYEYDIKELETKKEDAQHFLDVFVNAKEDKED